MFSSAFPYALGVLVGGSALGLAECRTVGSK